MSTLDPISGSPLYNIKAEGQNISIKIEKTSPTTARISWTIPAPYSGCDADTQAYNGIIVTLDSTPITRSKEPVNGTVYTADPTGDRNLHSGDTIDTALVVGAFYNDKVTTTVDVSGLQPNTAYYVSGFAVDNVLRYHTEGVHSYALPYGNEKEPDLNGYQIVTAGIQGTDPTGLVAATNYTFTIAVDGGDPATITINGTNAATYDDLVNEINKQIALIDGPLQSGAIPNLNSFYWDATNQKLFQWNGSTHVELEVLVEPTDPSIPTLNDYWYETDTNTLFKWDGLAWIAQNLIEYTQDPTNLECDDYWFNGTSAYKWDGDVWCQRNVYNQAIDPSTPPVLSCPLYWFDTANEYLHEWDDENNEWVDVNPVLWPTDPLSLVNGSYWFDLSTQELKVLALPNWNVVTTAFIQTTQPTAPANNALWYNPNTEELKQYNQIGSVWNVVPVIVWNKNPIAPSSCDIWWNTTLDQLNVWDVTTTSWVVASNFQQSAIDPSLPPTLTENDVWFNTTNNMLYKWDGSEFVAVTFINYPTDPRLPAVGDVWKNTTTNTFSVWSPNWVAIDPKLTGDDPYTPVAGDYWFDTTGNTLNMYNGVAWTPVLYSVTPYTPDNGDTYFNTTTQTLMTWDGYAWVPATLPAVVGIDDNGDLRFDSTSVGSESYIVLTDVTLFAALVPTTSINDSVRGYDGVSGQPSYKEVGVGSDGSADERREMMEYIRAELGYPFIDVELTKTQLDMCIDMALEILRQKSASGVRKNYFFITLSPTTQVYKLTDKRVGLNKIVNVMAIHRTRAALSGLGSLWDQAFIQHLYQHGAYDLSSYAFMNEYIETLEQLFATGIQFQWHEDTRELIINQVIGRNERVILETMIEKTEQEIMKDRMTRPWIKRWALAEAKEKLSQIRGKYATLPGAGGGISLNANDLATQAETMKAALLQEIDDYVVDHKEDVGMHGDFLIG